MELGSIDHEEKNVHVNTCLSGIYRFLWSESIFQAVKGIFKIDRLIY